MPRDKKTTNESSSSIEDKIKELNKLYGRDLFNSGLVDREKVSSGILTLDYLMQYQYEKRSLILLHGHEGSLKTTIALMMLAEAQRRGEDCLVVDVEKGFDKERAAMLGVDVRPGKIYIIDEPLSAEGYLEAMCKSVDIFGFILLDSSTAMVGQQVAEKNLTDGTTRAPLASALSSGLGKLNYANKNSTIVMIGQERDNPGNTGAPQYLPGGKAQKFYANYRFQFKVVEYYDEDGNKVGETINQVGHKPIHSCLLRIVNKKNRRGEQQMAEELIFNFKTCKIDEIFETIKIGKRVGVIETSGSWMTIPGIEKQMQDKTLREHLEANEDVLNNLRMLIIKKLEEI